MIVILTFYWQKFLSFRASAKNHLKKVLLCQKYYQNHYYNYLLILNSLAVPWSSIKSSVRIPLHKKWSFLLTISSVNVTKSTVSWRNLKNLLKKSLMENFIFCAVSFQRSIQQLVKHLKSSILQNGFQSLAIFAYVWLDSEYAPVFKNKALPRF